VGGGGEEATTKKKGKKKRRLLCVPGISVIRESDTLLKGGKGKKKETKKRKKVNSFGDHFLESDPDHLKRTREGRSVRKKKKKKKKRERKDNVRIDQNFRTKNTSFPLAARSKECGKKRKRLSI